MPDDKKNPRDEFKDLIREVLQEEGVVKKKGPAKKPEGSGEGFFDSLGKFLRGEPAE